MSVYIPAKFAGMYAHRTMCNYDIIKEISEKKEDVNRIADRKKFEAYDVTQLINSLFGLVILPYEKFKYRRDQGLNQDGSERTLKNRAPVEYREICSEIDTYKNNKQIYSNCNDRRSPVSHLIKHIRNSLAHSGDKGLHFWPFDNGLEITHVYFYDQDPENKEKEFALKLSTDQIKTLCKLIMNLYQKIEEQSTRDYPMNINNIEELLSKGIAP